MEVSFNENTICLLDSFRVSLLVNIKVQNLSLFFKLCNYCNTKLKSSLNRIFWRRSSKRPSFEFMQISTPFGDIANNLWGKGLYAVSFSCNKVCGLFMYTEAFGESQKKKFGVTKPTHLVNRNKTPKWDIN